MHVFMLIYTAIDIFFLSTHPETFKKVNFKCFSGIFFDHDLGVAGAMLCLSYRITIVMTIGEHFFSLYNACHSMQYKLEKQHFQCQKCLQTKQSTFAFRVPD